MESLGKGFKVYIGVSASKITNGHSSEDYPGVPDLEVALYEWTPNARGPIIKEPVISTASTVDPIGDTSGSSTIPKQHTIRCQYLGGNNHMVPCIHIGEQVWVLQYEGGDMWYWLPMARYTDQGIRQHEHIRWFAMNRPKSVVGKNKFGDVTDQETYFVDINTNPGQKLLQVHTAHNDGEHCGYDIRIHPERGYLEVVDTKGNILFLDSANTIWKMRNIDESYIELNKQDITISCEHDLKIHCGNDMTVEVGNDRKQNIGHDETVQIDHDRKQTVSNDETVDIGNDRKQTVGNDETVEVKNDRKQTIGNDETIDIKNDESLKVGGSRTQTISSDDTLSISASYSLKCQSMSAQYTMANFTGATQFGGPSFIVSAASGVVPVVIVYGSNAW